MRRTAVEFGYVVVRPSVGERSKPGPEQQPTRAPVRVEASVMIMRGFPDVPSGVRGLG